MRGRTNDARVSIDNVLDCVFFSFVVDYAVAFFNSCALARERLSPLYHCFVSHSGFSGGANTANGDEGRWKKKLG